MTGPRFLSRLKIIRPPMNVSRSYFAIDISLSLVTEFEYIIKDLCVFKFFSFPGVGKMPLGGYTSKKLKGTIQKKEKI